jgi:hypothetical protein
MKIICFSSYTSIWYFAFAEAVIAHELQKKGHEILYITPGSEFINRSNSANERILRKEFNLKRYELRTSITKNDRKKIDILMSGLTNNNFEKLIVNKINIGKIALYELMLNRKKMTLNFNDREWGECLIEIKNTLISIFACRSILKREKPDAILMYSSLYSVNHAWRKFAKQKNIPVYFLHHGGNLSDTDNTLIVAKNDSYYFFDRLIKIWEKIKNNPVNQEMLSYITDHFLELLKAKHDLVYSSPKGNNQINIKKIFNINSKQKILTATMSSHDELFAAEYVGVKNKTKNLIFKTQIDWINHLINYVKERKDLSLIIRVHPREFPNKRESLKSEHAITLEKTFKNLPSNVKINWPTDNISIYDLAMETDVFLNAWSSVGVEMSLLGIPVVIYSKDMIHYPADLNYLAKNINDYFAKIEMALNDGWSYERIKKTYRWLVLSYYRIIMRFKSKKPKSKPIKSKPSKFTQVFSKHILSSLPSRYQHLLIKLIGTIPGLKSQKTHREACRKQLLEKIDINSLIKMISKNSDTLFNDDEDNVDQVSLKEEDKYICDEIKRLYIALYGGLPKKIKIKKNSLRYNFKQTFN